MSVGHVVCDVDPCVCFLAAVAKAVAVSESDNDLPFSSSAGARGQIAELPAPSPNKMGPVWSVECVCD